MTRMIGQLIAFLVLMLLALPAARAAEPQVLVYTHNGLTEAGKKGFVHDNIATAAAAIRQLGQENHFGVDVSDDPAAFTDENLKKYRAIVFNNTNNKAFETKDQKAAFQRFIHAGGGFVGIHSASGSERNWPWYWQLIGGTFVVHAAFQPFTVKVVDRQHPSTAGYTDETFTWKDEFYFLREMPDDLHVLLAGDLANLKATKDFKDKHRTEKYGDWHPLAWCHEFEGGRAWYTSLGHSKDAYADPLFRKHILGGIQWAMGEKK